MKKNNWLTAPQYARHVGVCLSTLNKWVREGTIEFEWHGPMRMFRPSAKHPPVGRGRPVKRGNKS